MCWEDIDTIGWIGVLISVFQTGQVAWYVNIAVHLAMARVHCAELVALEV